MRANENQKQILQAVATFLSRDDVDFLDKLAKDIFFSTGSKVPRSTLIAWMVDILKGLGVNGEAIYSEEDLHKKLMQALKMHGQNMERTHEE